MSRLVLGVIGHVDHGKTALVRALTGMETDRLPEERQRGISIALGFAHARIGGLEVDFIDMPGHERFVRTMVSGATGVDAVLIAVSAREGVSAQTVEHVEIAGLLGLDRAIVAVTKADLVDADAAQAVGRDAVQLAGRAGLEVGPPVRVSAATGHGLDRLRAEIGALPARGGEKPDDGFFYLPVDRAFSLPGHGTIVTGTLRRGGLGDESADAVLVPDEVPVRVRRMHVHGERVRSARPGQRVALNLRDIEAGRIARGAAIAPRGLLEPTNWLLVELRSVPGAPVVRTTQPLQLLYGTDEVEVRLRLLDRDDLGPGERGLAQLKTVRPVVLPTRERFVLRTASPSITVAGGSVLDTSPRRLRRHAPGVLSRARALAGSSPPGIALAETERAGVGGVPLATLARLAGSGIRRMEEVLEALPVIVDRQQVVAARSAFDRVMADVPAAIAEGERSGGGGLAREQLRTSLPDTAPSLIDEAVFRLTAASVVRQEAGRYRTVRPAEDALRAKQDAVAAADIAEQIRRAGLQPPVVTNDARMRSLVDRLVRQGVLIRTVDRVQEREIIFHPEAIQAAKERLSRILEDTGGGLRVTEIGAALGITRRYSVPLLEYLDMIRFTRRVADRRILNPVSDGLERPG